MKRALLAVGLLALVLGGCDPKPFFERLFGNTPEQRARQRLGIVLSGIEGKGDMPAGTTVAKWYSDAGTFVGNRDVFAETAAFEEWRGRRGLKKITSFEITDATVVSGSGEDVVVEVAARVNGRRKTFKVPKNGPIE